MYWVSYQQLLIRLVLLLVNNKNTYLRFKMVMDNYRCTTLMRYINTIGQIVRNYFSATGGLVTFFAPWNEAFERIPEAIERRLLRDRIWLEQILKLHIVPAKELTTDEITNETIVATVDNMRHLYFIRGEWPKNNVSKLFNPKSFASMFDFSILCDWRRCPSRNTDG